MMENIEYTVIFVIIYVWNDLIKIIWNEELILLLFVKTTTKVYEKIENLFLISNNLKQVSLNYNCVVCDKTIKLQSKNNHLKSLTHNQYGKSIRTNHTAWNPNLFDIDELFNDYITDQNKHFGVFLFKCEFKLDVKNLSLHIEIDFCRKTTNIDYIRCFLYWIDCFTERDINILILIKRVLKLLVIKEIWIENNKLFN